MEIILSKIFLNNKVSENTVKAMLSSLLDIGIDEDSSIGSIDLFNLNNRLEKIIRKEEDCETFIKKLKSIEKLSKEIKHYDENVSRKK